MKGQILIAGKWRWDIYEEALANGFRANNWSVIPFKCFTHIDSNFITKVQSKLKIGTDLNRINNKLLRIIERELPQVVLFYRTDLIFPKTLLRIKEMRPQTMLILYHNDNPFIGFSNQVIWRHYLNSIALADLTLVYRPNDIEQVQRYGARRATLLPPHYISYVHRPVSYGSSNSNLDVLFIGHYEDDGRIDVLNYLVENGIALNVFGTGWESMKKRYPWLSNQDLRRVGGEEYSRLISTAKMALVFLSHKNRDVWTRRCFEIPACGTLMLAPRTPELDQLFEDGSEAVYFDSRADLLNKVRYYLNHAERRQQIAEAGRRRCLKDGHSEIDRARKIIELISLK
jgi:spore maturation protein CgeB